MGRLSVRTTHQIAYLKTGQWAINPGGTPDVPAQNLTPTKRDKQINKVGTDTLLKIKDDEEEPLAYDNSTSRKKLASRWFLSSDRAGH